MKLEQWVDQSKQWIESKNETIHKTLNETLNDTLNDTLSNFLSRSFTESFSQLKESLSDLLPEAPLLPDELRSIQSRLENEWTDLLTSLNHGERYFDASKTLITLIGRIELLQRFSSKNSEPKYLLQLQTLHERNAKELADLCKRQGGAWIKAAQFLSCQSSLLPAVYATHLKELQDQAPSVSWEEIVAVLEAEWGAEWEKRCTIDPIPIATASIAQVHRAKFALGPEIALKIQLPQIEEKIESDLYFFSKVAQLLQRRVSGVDCEQIMRELSKNIRLELDYYHEASNLTRFFSFYQAEQWVFPSLINDLLTPKILAMSFVEGVPLRHFLDEVPSAADSLLKELVHSFVQQIFVSGLFHADPHPGNFLVTPQGKIALLDFGAVGELSQEESKHYRNIVTALLLKQESGFSELLKLAGFEVPDPALLEQLLFHPETKTKNASKNENPQENENLSPLSALSRNVNIMQKAQVKIPDNFVLMARVLSYIGGILKQYQVKISLQELAFSLM